MRLAGLHARQVRLLGVEVVPDHHDPSERELRERAVGVRDVEAGSASKEGGASNVLGDGDDPRRVSVIGQLREVGPEVLDRMAGRLFSQGAQWPQARTSPPVPLAAASASTRVLYGPCHLPLAVLADSCFP